MADVMQTAVPTYAVQPDAPDASGPTWIPTAIAILRHEDSAEGANLVECDLDAVAQADDTHTGEWYIKRRFFSSFLSCG
jgi:hypothetical protein